MGDADNALPPSKKRAAGRELSRDNPGLDDEEDSSGQEAGTFKKASEEVLAGRRIVKVRRNQSSSSSNPFAGIRLVQPSTTPAGVEALAASENKVLEDTKKDAGKETEKAEDEQKKVDEPQTNEAAATIDTGKDEEESGEQVESKSNEQAAEAPAANQTEKGEDEGSKLENIVDEKATEAAEDTKSVDEEAAKSEADNENRAGVQKKTENEEHPAGVDSKTENEDGSGADGSSLSSFQQLSSTQNAFTGLAGTGLSTSTFSFGAAAKDGSASGSGTTFGFGLPNNGNSSIFNNPGTSILPKNEGTLFPSKEEVVVKTGEENETVVFNADSVLFEFLDGGWKERGKGEIKVNVLSGETKKARLLMRTKGNYRLILNASLFPDMKLTNMDKKGITFACVNSVGEGKEEGLSTFALKFKDVLIVEEFKAAVLANKDNKTKPPALRTPENSPKRSED